MALNERRILCLTRTQRYSIAVLGVILTASLRSALDPVLQTELPLFLFVIPVILAGWYGGLGPGLLATFLSLLTGDYLFYKDHLNIERLAGFALVGALFSILSERTRNAIKG